ATLPRYHDDGIAIAETRFAADLVIPQHEHLNPFFCFVLNGRGTRSWPARAGADRPMALTLFPAGVPHANRWYGGGGEALHVEFSPLWLERLGGHAGVLRTPSDFAAGAPGVIDAPAGGRVPRARYGHAPGGRGPGARAGGRLRALGRPARRRRRAPRMAGSRRSHAARTLP